MFQKVGEICRFCYCFCVNFIIDFIVLRHFCSIFSCPPFFLFCVCASRRTRVWVGGAEIYKRVKYYSLIWSKEKSYQLEGLFNRRDNDFFFFGEFQKPKGLEISRERDMGNTGRIMIVDKCLCQIRNNAIQNVLLVGVIVCPCWILVSIDWLKLCIIWQSTSC